MDLLIGVESPFPKMPDGGRDYDLWEHPILVLGQFFSVLHLLQFLEDGSPQP